MRCSGGAAILRAASLTVAPAERVALMGRNGAGKSTLLRHAAGLMKPTRGKIRTAGRVAMLLQNPNDYLIHDTVAEEAPPEALEMVGLGPEAFARRHPRDLSGGERQRLALAIVLGGGVADPPAVVCLDEPTRGMDRAHKGALASLLKTLDAAVIVATHDPEFVAAFADRVVLLADGAPIADGPVAEVLTGGTYFATEVARILGGAGGALTPDQGIELTRRERRSARGARVSWLASFGILAIALIAGFVWYERDGLDARTVALVATLAALAALGRIAFAAIPNVKPTTDIVLISGYALGGAPGFAVGAIAGLTSNFFFGQGPWTPWQMAAWGATGIIGAGLARLTGRRIGRWPLALVCGVVGFAFAAFQDVGDWVTYSDHSTAQLGIYVAKGVGFDFVHAAGCVVFALAFGPALIRSIQRFARRLHVVWEPARPAVDSPSRPAPPIELGLFLVATVVASAALLATQSADPAAAATPTSYLLSAQNSDGGFGPSPGAASTSLYAGWAALGLAAEGHNPLDVRHGGASLLDYIEANQEHDPGSIERTILVLHAAGESASSLVARLQQLIRANGSVQNQVNLTSFAVLALRAAGVAPPANMLGWLVRQQDSDGGYNFATAGGSSDIDDTGAALQALAGADGARAACPAASGGVPAPPAGARWRFAAGAGRRHQFAVDGVGGPGTTRRRRRPERGPPRREPLAAHLPDVPDRPRRARPLLALARSDAGVVDRAGTDRAGRQGASDPGRVPRCVAGPAPHLGDLDHRGAATSHRLRGRQDVTPEKGACQQPAPQIARRPRRRRRMTRLRPMPPRGRTRVRTGRPGLVSRPANSLAFEAPLAALALS